MKMEIWLTAHGGGTVRSVHVQLKESVEAGSVLVELELEHTGFSVMKVGDGVAGLAASSASIAPIAINSPRWATSAHPASPTCSSR